MSFSSQGIFISELSRVNTLKFFESGIYVICQIIYIRIFLYAPPPPFFPGKVNQGKVAPSCSRTWLDERPPPPPLGNQDPVEVNCSSPRLAGHCAGLNLAKSDSVKVATMQSPTLCRGPQYRVRLYLCRGPKNRV